MAGRKTPTPKKSHRSTVLKLLGFMILLPVMFVSGMMFFAYFQYGSVPGFIRADFPFNLSSFQIIIGTLGIIGLLGSPIVHGRRRRSKKASLSQLKMTPMSFSKHEPSHPLMNTQRPARDNNFVFKKTKNRGRISRNSMGQKLPPSYVTDPDNSN